MDKNDGKTIFTYDGRRNIADDERSFVFFEKSGKYFYIHNNKSENYSKIINAQVYTMPKQEIKTIN